MRDFMAYKQFQKELEKEKEMRDRLDYLKGIEDRNRKEEEKQRQWRKYYEDFAHLQQGRGQDYVQKVIVPVNEREKQREIKRHMDIQDMQAKEREQYVNSLGKKAMSQAEIDEFNRRQLELKN